VTFLVGKIVEDIVAGAPNNAEGEDNTGRVKKLRVGRDDHPYVSAQAFRRWLRDSLPSAEPRSGVTRSGTGKNQQAHTAGRPDQFLDDDLFGYMVAVKKENYQRDAVLARVPEVPQRWLRLANSGAFWAMPPAIREAFRTLAVQLEPDGARQVASQFRDVAGALGEAPGGTGWDLPGAGSEVTAALAELRVALGLVHRALSTTATDAAEGITRVTDRTVRVDGSGRMV
jgi:hypothetical protein